LVEEGICKPSAASLDDKSLFYCSSIVCVYSLSLFSSWEDMDIKKKLLAMKAELLIMRQQVETNFIQEVAISNIIHAITEALKKLGKEKTE